MKEQASPAFDSIAVEYDDVFTRSWIGQQQRAQVWRFLEKNIHVERENVILELNCGTGEDACMLAEKGHKVVATDISEFMIEQAKLKQRERSINRLELILTDMKSVASLFGNERFDLIFSNFGGLNCLSPTEIKLLSQDLAGLLQKPGKIILVVMSRKCIWEKFYFYFKGMKSQAQRRNSPGAVRVNLGKSEQKTWYYSPEEISNLFKEHFKKEKARAIGLFVPPSYLEPGIRNKNFLKIMLKGLDRIFSSFPFFANYGDHFIIELRKK